MDELDDLLNAEDDAPAASHKSGDMEADEAMADEPAQHEAPPEMPPSPAAEAETIDPQLTLRDRRNQQCIELMSERQLDR
ncbi:hypothetical protein WJX84_002483, partial [Apatococcus fuscideae]